MKKILFYYSKLKIDAKKELTMLFGLNVCIIGSLLVLSFVYSLKFLFLIFPILILIIFYYYYALTKRYNKLINEKEIAFYGFYRNILNYLENNETLYSALNLEKEYIDIILKDDLDNLISDIQNDTSLLPFINFSDNFKNEMIKQMILLLYQSQNSGLQIEVFENVYNTLTIINNKSIESFIEAEKRKIDRYQFYPLILSAIIIIIFSIFSLTSLGGNLLV